MEGVTIGAIIVGAAKGAVIGAVIGGIAAAIMGGDIGSGILHGAIGGAVTGAIGGALGAMSSTTVETGGQAIKSAGSTGSQMAGSAARQTAQSGAGGSVGGASGSWWDSFKTGLGGSLEGAEGGLLSNVSGKIAEGGFQLAGNLMTAKAQAEAAEEALEQQTEEAAANRELQKELAYASNSSALERAQIAAGVQREQIAENRRQFDTTLQEQRDKIAKAGSVLSNIRAARQGSYAVGDSIDKQTAQQTQDLLASKYDEDEGAANV